MLLGYRMVHLRINASNAGVLVITIQMDVVRDCLVNGETITTHVCPTLVNACTCPARTNQRTNKSTNPPTSAYHFTATDYRTFTVIKDGQGFECVGGLQWIRFYHSQEFSNKLRVGRIVSRIVQPM